MHTLPSIPNDSTGDVSVTLQMVADAAKCAVSTASRALRNDPVISPDVRLRVRDVAREMNYHPLRKRRSPAVLEKSQAGDLTGKQFAFVTLGIDRTLAMLPGVNAALNGVESSLSAEGASLQIVHVPQLGAPPASLRLDECDGLFLMGALQGTGVSENSPWLARALRMRPGVWVLGRPLDCPGHCVGANDLRLGTLAADYLMDRGHTRLAFLNPKPDHLLMMNRESGFVGQAFRRGASVARFAESPPGGWTLPLKPPHTIDSVQPLVDRLLDSTPRPTAIFASVDSVAAMVYGALQRRGVRVGQDISLISGNNDRSLLAALHPALTTFDIQAHEIGRLAVRHMSSCLARPTASQDITLSIDPLLVEGASVIQL